MTTVIRFVQLNKSKGQPDVNITNPDIMAETKARTGVRVAPIGAIGEQIVYGTFSSQKPNLIKALGLSGL